MVWRAPCGGRTSSQGDLLSGWVGGTVPLHLLLKTPCILLAGCGAQSPLHGRQRGQGWEGDGRWAVLACACPVGAAGGLLWLVAVLCVLAGVLWLSLWLSPGPCVPPGPAAAAAAAALCQQLRGRIDRGPERTAPLKRCPGAPDGLLFPEERAWERRVQNLVRAAVEAAVIVTPSPGAA